MPFRNSAVSHLKSNGFRAETAFCGTPISAFWAIFEGLWHFRPTPMLRRDRGAHKMSLDDGFQKLRKQRGETSLQAATNQNLTIILSFNS
jgi:hypothetical protein